MLIQAITFLWYSVKDAPISLAPTSYEQSTAHHDVKYAKQIKESDSGIAPPLYPVYRISAASSSPPVVVTNLLYHQQPAAVVMHSQAVQFNKQNTSI